MGLRYRTFRAAASALLVALAAGTGGMTGMGSALAADPATVALGGSLVDGSGHGLSGVHLEIQEELPPDGGLAAFQVVTTADGAFSADVYAWGTADAPASLSVRTPAGEQIELVGDSCSQTWGVAVSADVQLALADAAPQPLALTAQTTLLGEVCGTTGTPRPGGNGGNAGNGGTGGVSITPPPTDAAFRVATTEPDRLGPALLIGFVAGLTLAVLFLVPRRASRRPR